MAMTQAKMGSINIGDGSLHRYTETGVANTTLTSTTAAIGAPFRLLLVTVAYSAAATQAGVTTTLNSGVSSAYDTLINTGTANARYTAYQPIMDLPVGNSDAITVVAPAGGAGVIASITIYLEKL